MSISSARTLPLFDPSLLKPALLESLRRLQPRAQWRNPVMFIVYIGSIFTTLLLVHALSSPADASMRPAFVLAITVWLWFTVLFANFAEALAEGRSKADAPEIDGKVRVASHRPLRVGEIVSVRIDSADAYDLFGTAV